VVDGWTPILTTLKEYLAKKYKGKVVPTHSYKEKWGELVIDFRSGFDGEDMAVADFCEELSTKVCDTCGRPGEPRDLPWIRTLCDECLENHKKGNK